MHTPQTMKCLWPESDLTIYRRINALAEAFDSLFEAELVRNKGPWRSIDDLEIAVAEYIDWFNHRRLHGEIGMIPPVEAKQSYYDSHIPVGTTERVIESLY